MRSDSDAGRESDAATGALDIGSRVEASSGHENDRLQVARAEIRWVVGARAEAVRKSQGRALRRALAALEQGKDEEDDARRE